MRAQQRAYTVLVYLKSPDGPSHCGGTEFTRLTGLGQPGRGGGEEEGAGGAEREGRKHKEARKGLVVKPRAGDALIWPNFDIDGLSLFIFV